MRQLLESTLARATRYLEDLQTRRVFPSAEAVADLTELGGALPEHPEPSEQVRERLDRFGSPALLLVWLTISRSTNGQNAVTIMPFPACAIFARISGST